MALIAIVDYGMGNIHSVERALRHAAPEADIRLCSQARDILAADRVVFPGQGAMADCIRTLDEAGLREAVLNAAKNKPLLGVCVSLTSTVGVCEGERVPEGELPYLGYVVDWDDQEELGMPVTEATTQPPPPPQCGDAQLLPFASQQHPSPPLLLLH